MPTTWNPSDKGPNITLSGGDLTATISAGFFDQLVRSTDSKSTGKWVFAAVMNTADFTEGIGLCNSTQDLTDDFLPLANAILALRDSNTWRHNGTFPGATTQFWSSGTEVMIAVDADARTCWMSTDGGTTWRGSAVGDPAAGTNGQAIGFTGAIFATITTSDGRSWVGRFTDADIVGTIPAGFSAWDSAAAAEDPEVADPSAGIAERMHFDAVNFARLYSHLSYALPNIHAGTEVPQAVGDVGRAYLNAVQQHFALQTHPAYAPTSTWEDANAGFVLPSFPAAGAYVSDEELLTDNWTPAGSLTWETGNTDPEGGTKAIRYYTSGGYGAAMQFASSVWSFTAGPGNGVAGRVEVIAKTAGARYLRACTFDGTNDWGVIFDLDNGLVGSSRAGGGTEANPAITLIGDGWYTCSFDVTGDGTAWQDMQLGPTETDSTNFDASTTIAAGDGVYLFRFQFYPAPVGGSVNASAAQTLDLVTVAETAAVRVSASAAQTLDLVTVAETATVVVAASAAQTFDLVTVAETGTVVVAASASQTLDLVTQAATANASNSVNASASQTLALPAQTATAGVTVAASASQTLDLVTVAETAAVLVGASATQSLQLVSQAATGTVVDGRAASANQTLALVTQAASGVVVPSREASASQTLPLLTAAATSTVRVAANGNQTLPLITQAATGTAALGAISASATQTLSPPTQIVSILLWVAVPDATGSWTPVGDATGGWADTAGPSGTWIDAA